MAQDASIGDWLATAIQFLLPRRLLSALAGRLADSRRPWLKDLFISRFIAAFDVDMSEAEQTDPVAYESFNAFFTRALRPGVRPINDGGDVILSPADGRISEAGTITHGRLLQAKGRHYSLTDLLAGDEALAARFHNGHFLTVYLSPGDYHRVHMPCAGTPLRTVHVPGTLFAVKPSSVRCVPRLFARNRRSITVFQGDYGHFVHIMVGALIVGRIDLVPAVDDTTTRMAGGEEFGSFLLGSTVITLFEPGRAQWRDDLATETRLRMGEVVGRLR